MADRAMRRSSSNETKPSAHRVKTVRAENYVAQRRSTTPPVPRRGEPFVVNNPDVWVERDSESELRRPLLLQVLQKEKEPKRSPVQSQRPSLARVKSLESSRSSTLSERRSDESMHSPRKPFSPTPQHPLYYKLKYYHSLAPYDSNRLLRPPAHVIPSVLFTHSDKAVSSFRTIFTVYSTMLGSSLLSLPWAFQESGVLGGVLSVLLVAGLCLYMCCRIVQYGENGKYEDFFDICEHYLGRHGRTICWVSSLMVFLGALMAYNRLMSDAIYTGVNGVRSRITGTVPESTQLWSLHTAPIVVFLAVFPLTNLKEFTVLVKLNSLSVLWVAYSICFILGVSFFEEGVSFGAKGSTPSAPLFCRELPKFVGLLNLACFIHNAILPIMKQNRHQENNYRDVTIAYVMVALSYAIIGAIGYLAYRGVDGGLPQDFLMVFDIDYLPAVFARIALFFQLGGVFPLLVYIIRIQFFGFLAGTQYPGWAKVMVLNAIVVALSSIVAIFFPNVGDILRYTGSLTGFTYIFLLPVLVFWKRNAPLSTSSKVIHCIIVFWAGAVLVTQFV